MGDFIFSNRYNTLGYYTGLVDGEDPLGVKLLENVALIAPSQPEPVSYTLEKAWNLAEATILILGETARYPAQLADLFRVWCKDRAEIRLAWIANPNDLPDAWNIAAFSLAEGEGGRVLDSNVELRLTAEPGGYSLQFDKGLVAALAGPSALTFTGGGIAFGREAAMLAVGSGGLQFVLDSDLGPSLRYEFALPPGEPLVTSLDALGLGFWYSACASGAQREAYRYPFLRGHPQHDGLACKAQVTPNLLLDPTVSLIEALPAGGVDANFVTWFRSLYGRSTIVAPQGPIGLVFNAAGEGAFGLSPQGTFTMRFSDQQAPELTPLDVSAAQRDEKLSCGAVGTECIVVPAGTEVFTLELVAGQPSAAATCDGQTGLGYETTTAWARLSAPVDLRYEAQPAGQGTLYDASKVSPGPIAILDYFRPVPILLPPGGSAPLLPLVPLAGLPQGEERCPIELETTAIAPARKAVLAMTESARIEAGGHAPRLPEGMVIGVGELRCAVTPGGLVATFDDTGWVDVSIAGFAEADAAFGNSGRLRFAGPKGIANPLRDALQTSQQFIVFSNPEAIREFFSDREAPLAGGEAIENNTRVTLRDWEFLLGPEHWGRHGTILIVKNTPTAMQDLIADSASWTAAAAFNKNVAAVSLTLQKIAREARADRAAGRERMAMATGGEAGSEEHDLDFFVDTVLDSPDWNGFLFLNAALGSPPDDLAGMRAGIDPRQLFAHHIGVTQTPFTSIEDLAQRSSALFGLIRCADSRPLKSDGISYKFRVRELGVQFADSDIRNFRSTVDLAIGRIFGQATRLANDESPVSQMIGTRHMRGTGAAYSFKSINRIELLLGGGPLRMVALEEGEFVTKVVPPKGAAQGITRTSFNFAGFLEFTCVGPAEAEAAQFDIFSFDQLAFSTLAVDMDFDVAQPDRPSYTFSIQNLDLIEAQSIARANSLFEGFPIKLDSLIYGTGSPESQGSMTVQLPGEGDQEQLPKDWYGFTQVIDMGTLSDVTGAAGLKANLLVAWGPKRGQYYMGFNISGPSLSGLGMEFNLLGVLKLRAYALQLLNKQRQWTLMMTGLTLSAFGISIPPGGTFQFYIFGVADPTGSGNSLGWYGAWVADPEKPKSKPLLIGDSGARGALPRPPRLRNSPRYRFLDQTPKEGELQ